MGCSCKEPCWAESDPVTYGPCKGDIDVIDELCEQDEDGNVTDCYWVHACEAHADHWN